jgi:fructose-1-phosphate kinase PfkB-like protein
VTELVEEAAPLSPKDLDSLTSLVLQRLPEAEALCLSGSFPPGVPDDFYREFVEAARAREIPALVDAQRAPLRHALAGRPFMVKPNLEEAARTMGLDLSGDAQADAGAAIRALTEAGAAWAVVSIGSAGAFLGNQEAELWVINPPSIQVVNSVGSGDSLAAGVLCALARDKCSVPEAVVFGTACAAANCLTSTVGIVEPERAQALIPGVMLTRLA